MEPEVVTTPAVGVTTEILLYAYSDGIFPMSDSRDDPELFWVKPRNRGIIPLSGFHMSGSLRRRLRRLDYRIELNGDFEGVMEACADREETWINDTIFNLYSDLNCLGFAHSVEVWRGNRLEGGVYGVSLGQAFFGESMFSRISDGSKIALAYLVDHLRRTGFRLLDVQFITPHLASLGAIEISCAAYMELLGDALQENARFLSLPVETDPQEVIQRNTQTS